MADLLTRFPDLLRRVSVDPRQVPYEEWFKGMEEIAKNLSADETVRWLRLACRREREAVTDLVLEMRKHDPTFPAEMAEELHSVLAGAVLELALAYADPAAQAIALAVRVSRFSNWEPAFAELGGTALERLHALEIEVRSALDENRHEDLELESVDQAASVAPQIGGAGPAIASALTTIKSALENLQNQVKSTREELDIAWWILSESLADGKSFSKVQPTALAASVAFDLKRFTRFDLPPPSAGPILARALEIGHAQSGKASIRQFVNASSRSSRSDLVQASKLSGDLTPLALLCGISLEVDDADSWIPLARAKTQIDLDAEHALHRLAHQFYEELCLLELLQTHEPK